MKRFKVIYLKKTKFGEMWAKEFVKMVSLSDKYDFGFRGIRTSMKKINSLNLLFNMSKQDIKFIFFKCKKFDYVKQNVITLMKKSFNENIITEFLKKNPELLEVFMK